MIEIRGVHKRFGSQQVLRGVDLNIGNGTTTAIVGPSGTGKSVLLKIITGLLPIDKGEVLINGKPVILADDLGSAEPPARMGVLFQNAALFDSLTLYDNVAFPLRFRSRMKEPEIKTRTLHALTQVELQQYATKLPGEVSIGMRKRVGIARALVVEPEILLFDEPNTGLDPEMGQDIYDLINLTQQKFGFTGIVISHEIPEVFHVCSRVAMLYQGTVQMEGTVDEFLRSPIPVVQQFVQGSSEGPIQLS